VRKSSFRDVATPRRRPKRSHYVKCPCHFVVKFWLSESFRVRAGVKTSLDTDSENEINTVTLPATVPSSLDGTVAGI